MTDRIVYLDPDPHTAVLKLLPWYVTGRLDASEHAEVETHLAGCAACRSELDFERTLQAAIRGRDGAVAVDGPDADADADTDADWARIGNGIRPLTEIAAEADGRPWFAWRPVSAWAVPAVLSVALVVAWAVTLGPAGHRGEDYRALAAVPEDSATAVVRFRPEATEAQMRASLNASGARLVDGPTVTDAWIVRLPRDRYVAAMDTLRRQPAVALVEALEGKGAR